MEHINITFIVLSISYLEIIIILQKWLNNDSQQNLKIQSVNYTGVYLKIVKKISNRVILSNAKMKIRKDKKERKEFYQTKNEMTLKNESCNHEIILKILISNQTHILNFVVNLHKSVRTIVYTIHSPIITLKYNFSRKISSKIKEIGRSLQRDERVACSYL